MKEIIFDSLCELDKLPTGAVPSGSDVRFGIRAKSSLYVSSMELVLIDDRYNSRVRYRLEKVWSQNGYDRFEGSVHFDEPGLFWYYFAYNCQGCEKFAGKGEQEITISDFEPASWQLTIFDKDYTTPDWICGGAFYHIFVDRFNNIGNKITRNNAILRDDWGGVPNYLPDENGEVQNNDFFGGNLKGIIEKLPYLHELGITCIYLSPIFEAYSNHKYDTGDYMKIDPLFGDEEVFSELCEKAKELGMRVILDGVFNHTGSDSKYFNKKGHYNSLGAYQSKESPYYSWYNFENWPDKYESWWGIDTLPQVNETSQSYRSFIFGKDGVLEKWLKLGASGWRLDVADELPDEFLAELRTCVKNCKPDALIIGEVWEDASNKIAYSKRRRYFQGHELDSVMNYPFKDAIIHYVLTGDAESIRYTVESICENYPKPSLDCLMNGLGTHDTPRVLTILGGVEFENRSERAYARLSPSQYSAAKKKLFIASILQFTLPGVPCIYYGDEAGMEGYEDPFNRRCYPWGQEDHELVNWYKKLLNMRKESPSLAGGSYRTICGEKGVYSFVRNCIDQKLYVIINLGCSVVPIVGGKPLIHTNCEITDSGMIVKPFGAAVIEIPKN